MRALIVRIENGFTPEQIAAGLDTPKYRPPISADGYATGTSPLTQLERRKAWWAGKIRTRELVRDDLRREAMAAAHQGTSDRRADPDSVEVRAGALQEMRLASVRAVALFKELMALAEQSQRAIDEYQQRMSTCSE